jgi:hypothetical protein
VTISPAPYVSAVDITQTFPLGVSWATIGKVGSTNPSEQQNAAALDQICRHATAQTRGEVQQDIHTTIATERQVGPSAWLGVIANGQGRMMCRQFPVWRIVSAAVGPASGFPKNWRVIPPGGVYPEFSGAMEGVLPAGIGGWSNAVLIDPSYFGWGFGRYGTEVQLTTLHGWPHTQLTADVAADVTELPVDQVAGFVTNASPQIMDGAATEQVTISSSASNAPSAYSATVTYAPGQMVVEGETTYQCLIPSGPGAPNGVQIPAGTSAYWSPTIEPNGRGMITLSEPTTSSHEAGTILTALPHDIRWATALYAKALALQRGLATVSIPGQSGKAVSTEGAIDDAMKEAVALLTPYRRIL